MPITIPSTSILTCTFNMGPLLSRAARSVFQQTCKDFEWLVLDDGSSDGTWEYLQSFRHLPFVRLYRFAERQGLTEARNYLLAEARGKYLSILDADDFISRWKTERHGALFGTDSDTSVVWGRSLIIYDDKSWEVIPEKPATVQWDILSDYQATHSATTWRKSSVLRVGGYDAATQLVEAPDLFLKVGDRGKQVFCNSLACAKYVLRESAFRKLLTPELRAEWSRKLITATLNRRRYL